jgi:ubiquinone/menaquinone biosynthesis C-methylase UbiE
LFPVRWKEYRELKYWRRCKREGTNLSNTHFEKFFTLHFGLGKDFYEDRRVLDIGCGPCGSLEWADNAADRVGLDPLAEQYKELGTASHRMRYVSAYSEDMPFDDDYFDVVSSFNSLDHVQNLSATVSEIKRVLRPGGVFLLITELGHKKTATEPQEFGWDIVEMFSPELEIVETSHFEKTADGIYQSADEGKPFHFDQTTERHGVLSAKLRKHTRPRSGNQA